MRESKFRAWDKKRKQFVPNGEIVFSFYGDTHISVIPNDITYIYDDSTEERFTRFEVTEYTGIKDKNGVEIYEGDIVIKDEYIWFCDGVPNYRGTVEFVFSQWQVIAHGINSSIRGISDGINFGINDDGIEENKNSKWEVIGNIYENPELLEDKQ